MRHCKFAGYVTDTKGVRWRVWVADDPASNVLMHGGTWSALPMDTAAWRSPVGGLCNPRDGDPIFVTREVLKAAPQGVVELPPVVAWAPSPRPEFMRRIHLCESAQDAADLAEVCATESFRHFATADELRQLGEAHYHWPHHWLPGMKEHIFGTSTQTQAERTMSEDKPISALSSTVEMTRTAAVTGAKLGAAKAANDLLVDGAVAALIKAGVPAAALEAPLLRTLLSLVMPTAIHTLAAGAPSLVPQADRVKAASMFAMTSATADAVAPLVASLKPMLLKLAELAPKGEIEGERADIDVQPGAEEARSEVSV